MTGLRGKKNVYRCEKCHASFVTVDRDKGTTPFATSCQATPGCRGPATSKFYLVDQTQPATHEWYRASDEEAAARSPWSREHHRRGGLFLRKIETAET